MSIYNVWCNMKQRCYNKNNPDYKHYGGRGIQICSEWRESFQTFYDYVSQLAHFSEKGYSLDRIDNNGNYKPGNVRWATRTTQMNNTRHQSRLETRKIYPPIIRYLRRNGFEEKGGKGSHQKMYNPKTKRTTEIPMHSKDLGKGLSIKMKIYYPAIFFPDETGAGHKIFGVAVPDIEGCLTQGEDLTDAMNWVVDAIGTMLDGVDEKDYPKPSKPADVDLSDYPPDSIVNVIEFDSEKYFHAIRYAAQKKGLNIKQAAKLIGCPYRTMQNYWNGERKPPAWLERLIVAEINRR